MSNTAKVPACSACCVESWLLPRNWSCCYS